MVTLLGESQADHIRTKPNGDKKETSPTILTYCRTFFIVSVLLKRQKRGSVWKFGGFDSGQSHP